MKFNTISAADVAVLRKAYKVLNKLKEYENKLTEVELDAIGDTTKDYKAVAMKHWRMFDELEALHISVKENGDMSLDAF